MISNLRIPVSICVRGRGLRGCSPLEYVQMAIFGQKASLIRAKPQFDFRASEWENIRARDLSPLHEAGPVYAYACAKEVRQGRHGCGRECHGMGGGGGHHGWGRWGPHRDGHPLWQLECGTVHYVLQPVVVQFVERHPHTIFMDDNAHPHLTRVVHQFLEDNIIERMDPWPARLPDIPDMNPHRGHKGPTSESRKWEHPAWWHTSRPGSLPDREVDKPSTGESTRSDIQHAPNWLTVMVAQHDIENDCK